MKVQQKLLPSSYPCVTLDTAAMPLKVQLFLKYDMARLPVIKITGSNAGKCKGGFKS